MPVIWQRYHEKVLYSLMRPGKNEKKKNAAGERGRKIVIEREGYCINEAMTKRWVFE